jgi:hypothetical protein
VHVTKFQIAIDELLRMARSREPAAVLDYMKSVVVSVRNITEDIGDVSQEDSELSRQRYKLKARVSATANNLITASKNFATAKGLSPVSLLDAAASHLTAAVVELIKTVKIRPTPAGELEDDDDGNLPPAASSGYFSVSNGRVSGESVYSSASSPRGSISLRPRSQSKEPWPARRPQSRNGLVNGSNKALPTVPAMKMGFGIRTQESNVEELKVC